MINHPNKGLVTIAIPAYKDKWLAEAIESALNQNYDNVELIIVDDHSPYGLMRIVKPYLKDERVCYYYNEKNLGKESIVLNWNRCLELAHGEFFVLLCDDDILFPDFITSLLDLVKKYPSCNIFHGRRIVFNEVTCQKKEDSEWMEYEDYESFLQNKLRRRREHTISEFLFKTAILNKMKFIDFPIAWGSDDATILSLVKQGGIASSKRFLTCFRISSDNISNVHNYIYEKAIGRVSYYTWFLKFENRNEYRDLIIREFDWFMFSLIKRSNFFLKIKILRIVPNYVWGIKQKLVILLFR